MHTHQIFTEASLRWRTPLEQPDFLPTTKDEMKRLGWNELDILLVSGDAYVDHPTFGIPLLGRWLVAHGYRTGIVAQPRWDCPDDVMRMGRPRLFAGVSAGAIDSMLAHYTAFRKKRHDDAYTPGGKAGARPNRAVIVYTNLVRQAFPQLPVIIGGIEASLRRSTHFDFWTDGLRRSLLLDAKADLLVYGMGEYAMRSAAVRLDAARDERGADAPVSDVLAGIEGTAFMSRGADFMDEIAALTGQHEEGESAPAIMTMPSHEDIVADVKKLMAATVLQERHVHAGNTWAVQAVGKRAIIFAPPAKPMETEDLDALYALPFSRRSHPSYNAPIPAEEMIRTSITTHRGCGGGCSFCSLALHQGRRIASRSRESIMLEAEGLAKASGRKSGRGVAISDVGGPSANMWQAKCTLNASKCKRESCMFPSICKGFKVKQGDAIDLLHEISGMEGVRHVRIASGVRFDLALKDEKALRAYTMEFTGGQLKVAPEHICENVLAAMRKPNVSVFKEFLDAFERFSHEAGKEQYVIPYLMSAFPSCTDNDMHYLGDWLRARGWSPQQVQCFIPTPGTVATAMFAAGIDAEGNPVTVARTDAERLRQHAILMPDMGRKPASGHGKHSGGRDGKHDGPNNRDGKSQARHKSGRQGSAYSMPSEQGEQSPRRGSAYDYAPDRRPNRDDDSRDRNDGRRKQNHNGHNGHTANDRKPSNGGSCTRNSGSRKNSRTNKGNR
ncbi:MAG: YgiQ family radical SAM protein [Pseudomonadota bacterium]